MISQEVDLVAGDFNGTAWRFRSRDNLSTTDEAFSVGKNGCFPVVITIHNTSLKNACSASTSTFGAKILSLPRSNTQVVPIVNGAICLSTAVAHPESRVDPPDIKSIARKIGMFSHRAAHWNWKQKFTCECDGTASRMKHRDNRLGSEGPAELSVS